MTERVKTKNKLKQLSRQLTALNEDFMAAILPYALQFEDIRALGEAIVDVLVLVSKKLDEIERQI